MKTLVVEDDFTSRIVMQEMLRRYGLVHIAVNGHEALEAFEAAAAAGDPYDLVCLDIMMPGLSGHDVLKELRASEERRGVLGPVAAKVFMTTALSDGENVFKAFREQCEAYLVKPIDLATLRENLVKFGLAAA